ncbi:hypothetical protein LR48_Vigan01g100100 [Vigna angularis]|uniref:Uncharacterized protein n=1 Tax=Phaseolus angularis TaxID=3914 RepID=A0A0L9TLX0_PHAAN|nr:hypothetical protein LR48_Vigan01g100100 [Vigna angularis]
MEWKEIGILLGERAKNDGGSRDRAPNKGLIDQKDRSIGEGRGYDSVEKLTRERKNETCECGNVDVERNDAGEDEDNVLETVADAGHVANDNRRKML